MPSAKEMNRPGHITTGNVLEDLGFSAQEIREMEIKHGLWVPIRDAIEVRKLTQAQLAKMLEIHQPDASLLLRGQLSRFSITRLLHFADRLQLTVTFSVAARNETAGTKTAARIPLRKAKQRSSPNKTTLPSQAKRKLTAAV